MIEFPAGVRVWLAAGHTDMRRGFDCLALLVQEQLKRSSSLKGWISRRNLHRLKFASQKSKLAGTIRGSCSPSGTSTGRRSCLRPGG